MQALKAITADVGTAELSYTITGNGKQSILIDTALASCQAEWAPFIRNYLKEYKVISYDRAGYGNSSLSCLPRSPRNIAAECMALLKTVGIQEKIILIGHSQGGLNMLAFAKEFPGMVGALVLIDPLSPDDNRLREETPSKIYKRSGADKSSNLKPGKLLGELKLLPFLKFLFKTGIPFYYKPGYTQDETLTILRHLTRRETYTAALEEYQLSHDAEYLHRLHDKQGFPDIKTALVLHSHETMKNEITEFGGLTDAEAGCFDAAWLELMREYLKFSSRSNLFEAEKSGHFVHLTEPEMVLQAIKWASEG